MPRRNKPTARKQASSNRRKKLRDIGGSPDVVVALPVVSTDTGTSTGTGDAA